MMAGRYTKTVVPLDPKGDDPLKETKKFSYRPAWFLFFLCLIVFTLTAYGGIRSTDSEIVFRTAQAMLEEGSLAVPEGVLWEGFGLAQGKDGRYYSIFGPTQSLMMVPFIMVAEAVNASSWIQRFPAPLHPSHQVGQGLFYYVGSVKPVDLDPHALRAAVSVFNVLVSALTVLVFWFLLVTLGHSSRTATLTAILLAFGSLLWPYSGTFFSEPLATLFTVLSLFFLLQEGQGKKNGSISPGLWTILGGLALGLASTVHITAVLFLPFFILLTDSKDRYTRPEMRKVWVAGAVFTLGFLLPMILLGYYNFIRFGNILETGRSVDMALADSLFYGRFTLSFLGLYGLVAGGAKGLLVTSPSTLLGIFSWRQFARRQGYLSHVLLAMVVFRIFFIALRTDWHGGYSLGPRYLVMIIPFTLIAVASWLEGPTGDNLSGLTLTFIATACVSVQLHFVLGEIFTFYYLIKWTYAPDGIAAMKVLYPYLTWEFSPLVALPADYRGPWLLEIIPLSNRALWMLGTVFWFPVLFYLQKWGRRLRMDRTELSS